MVKERRRHRRFVRRGGSSKLVAADVALAESKRLIAEIDVLLEHSHELLNRQALLHRTWRL
jgi:DNA-binding winged helix-turn-helix (wHTH) protein